ncbi:MAG TPA: GAF domain-containing protein, partial [Thermomicrobiaceae bacterium]|nr:GAF domain-containing protein [Thermomicrobiaceae bacterium]
MTVNDPVIPPDLRALSARLQHAAERMERLQLLIEALGETPTLEAVARTVLEEGLAAVGARRGAVLQRTGDMLTLLGASGYPEAELGGWSTIPLDQPLPATAAAAGEALFLGSREALVERFPLVNQRAFLQTAAALAAVPLRLDDRSLGVLFFGFDEPRAFEREDRSFILALGNQVAQALDRVELTSARRTNEQRQAFLAQASGLLASSLDYGVTLQQVAQLAVPMLADWCAVDIVSEARTLERLAVAHVDPAKIAWARELNERNPTDIETDQGIGLVLRTGEPLLIPEITEEMIEAAKPDEEQLEIIRRIGFSSLIIVPLTARGRTFGALTLVAAESGYHYGADDLAFAQDVADRAALAIDNARLYQEARQHAARATARAEASRAVVAVQFDLRSIIQSITRIVAEQVGDGVVVRLVSDDDQWLDVVAAHHPDAEKQQSLEGMFSTVRQRIDEGFNALVLESGQPLHIPAAKEAEFLQHLRPEYSGFHQQFGYHTLLIVPLRLRERIIGSIALFRDGSRGPYSAAEQSFAQDLADVAALAIDNARLYREAQDAVEVRERFLSMASHELKTPLTTIKALGQLLERLTGQPEPDRARLARLMRQLLQSTERFEELVNDLLDVSRIQQERLALHPESLDLRELAGEVLDRFSEGSERTEAHTLVLKAPEPVVGEWDASRLDQVLTNLISNALKYSPDG